MKYVTETNGEFKIVRKYNLYVTKEEGTHEKEKKTELTRKHT